VKQFNFRKTIARNNFTIIFGGVGCRRTVLHFSSGAKSKEPYKRTKLSKIRRAHQGWQNKVFGSIHGLKIHRQYGRRKPSSPFRR